MTLCANRIAQVIVLDDAAGVAILNDLDSAPRIRLSGGAVILGSSIYSGFAVFFIIEEMS
ncbi:hypothetical protein [Sinimarinibacterium sp. NLF-5-8]|uniref:hypothetical protein n=1 Tax=Sinimarinibacterium sp. NLF-5-8 TaxID=2698684 RepID=UPI00137C2000|nr:hypothetical protein [Sinimarinibacterium sp. NLF-5-8]QHS09802.1 hypothetical protein GT972_06285 [Sinimarinibacterium sp. NLF-5-8]